MVLYGTCSLRPVGGSIEVLLNDHPPIHNIFRNLTAGKDSHYVWSSGSPPFIDSVVSYLQVLKKCVKWLPLRRM